ncbi:MAG: ATP-binding protein [Planctomycetota bacterium]
MIKSLRWRLQIWHAVVLTGVLATFGVVVYSLHWQTRLQQIDAELDRTAEVLMTQLRRLLPRPTPFRGPGRPPSLSRSRPGTPPAKSAANDTKSASKSAESPAVTSARPTGESPRSRGDNDRSRDDGERGNRPPRERNAFERSLASGQLPLEFQHLFEGEDESHFYFVIWGRDGVVLKKSTSAPETPYPAIHLGEEGLPVRLVRQFGDRREVIHASRFDLNVLVGRSIAEDLAAEQRYGLWLFAAGGAVMAAGFLGGGWLTARAIRPILAMTATAESISAQNLNERIDLKETDTELGQLGSVLNRTLDRLQSAFEQQSRFTADASHELRTPLSVILAHTELALSRPRTAEEYQSSLGICQRASIRMQSLIEGLLMLARFDSGQPVLETTEFDLEHVTVECIEMVQSQAETRQIKMTTDFSPVRIRADRGRIGQVITNLLTNAIRYNHDGGTVCVKLRAVDHQVVICVTDTGVGIPADELPHIFERFYRVDKARTRPEGGSGLGLSICQTIVAAHGGTIVVRSEPGSGTTVEVHLPSAV